MPTGRRKDEDNRYFEAKSKRRKTQFCVFSLFRGTNFLYESENTSFRRFVISSFPRNNEKRR